MNAVELSSARSTTENGAGLVGWKYRTGERGNCMARRVKCTAFDERRAYITPSGVKDKVETKSRLEKLRL